MIPIYHPEKIRETKSEYVLIILWNIKSEIEEQLNYIREWNGKFMTFIPMVKKMVEKEARILITGASGFIGRSLSNYLNKNGFEVYCIVRENSDISMLEIDEDHIFRVKQSMDLYDYLKSIQPDVLIHLAGVFLASHNKESIENMLESNLVYSSLVVDAAVEAGCRKLINATTYWEHYLGEEFYPVNLYASTKKAFKDIIEYYVKWKNVSCIDLVIFDTYGPEDQRRKVINLLKEVSDGESFKMSGGEQKLYLCYIDDVCTAFFRAIEIINYEKKDRFHVEYAIKPKEAVSLKKIVNHILDITGKKIDILWGAYPYRQGEIMDPSVIGETLPGWSEKVDIVEGLKKCFL